MRRVATVMLLIFALLPLTSRALSPEPLPEVLRPWVDWVLHDEQERRCPFVYNEGEAYQCAWPTRLSLDLDNSGGRFNQQWRLYQESWLTLPGSDRLWQKVIDRAYRRWNAQPVR